MGLRHGRNVQVYINGVDLTGELNEVNPTSEQDLADVSAFGTQGHNFYPGLAKDSVTINGLYTDTERAVFEGMVQLTPSYAMMLVFGRASGLYSFAYATNDIMLKSNVIKGVVTDVNRISASFETDNYPFENCQMEVDSNGNNKITSLVTSTGGTLDSINSASNTTGGAGYLQALTVTGGTLTVSIQQSSSGAWAAETITTCTFTAASSSGTQRAAISGLIERYTRPVWTIAPVSTGSTCTFAVALKRY